MDFKEICTVTKIALEDRIIKTSAATIKQTTKRITKELISHNISVIVKLPF